MEIQLDAENFKRLKALTVPPPHSGWRWRWPVEEEWVGVDMARTVSTSGTGMVFSSSRTGGTSTYRVSDTFWAPTTQSIFMSHSLLTFA